MLIFHTKAVLLTYSSGLKAVELSWCVKTLLGKPCSNDCRTYRLNVQDLVTVCGLDKYFAKHWCICSFFSCWQSSLIRWAYGWCCVWTCEVLEFLGFEVKLSWCFWMQAFKWNINIIFIDRLWTLQCHFKGFKTVCNKDGISVWRHSTLFFLNPKTRNLIDNILPDDAVWKLSRAYCSYDSFHEYFIRSHSVFIHEPNCRVDTRESWYCRLVQRYLAEWEGGQTTSN